MKKLYYILFLLLSLNGFAQNVEYAPIGASWYTINYSFPDKIDYGKITVEKDTIIQNIPCRKLTALHNSDYGCGHSSKNIYTYQSNDTVYLYNSIGQRFFMHYDLGASQGDSWQIIITNEPNNQLDTLQVIVDSVGQTIVSGQSLRTIYTSQPNWENESYFFGQKFVEGIGSLGSMLPDFKYCDPPSGEIRCFISNILDYHSGDISVPCDYSNLSIHEVNREKFVLSPNPAHDYVKVNSLDGDIQHLLYEIVGIDGKMIRNDILQGDIINISSLKPGFYFIRIKDDSILNRYNEFKILKD